MNGSTQNALLEKPSREGNIELLRIVCMLLILAHHMVYHSAAMQTGHPVNRVIARFLFAGGMTGVNCFVMITGYFLAPFRAKRLFSILLETVFYSVGITVALWAAGLKNDLNWETLKNAALAVSRSPYWFVVMYLGLTAVLPLLQPAVKALGKNAHRWVLALGALYLCVIPTLTFQNPASQFFHQITWFFFLYVLGAYFKKYPARADGWLALHGALFLLMIAFMALSALWGDGHPELFQRVASRQNFFADKNTIPQLICSVALFRFFAGLKVKPGKLLLRLASASFGVYLIHDHGALRSFLWRDWGRIWQAAQGDEFLLTALLYPAGIYLICAGIDLLRRRFLERPALRLLAPLTERIDSWLAK